MAYTLPVFNVPVDVWNAGHTPALDAPDFENVTVQFYVYSRVSFDVQPCELELYQPPIQIRMPLSTLAIWVSGQIFEAPAESGRYYRARFKERLHLGFVNEYLVVYVVQCQSDGRAIARDIENAVACGEPTDGGSGELSGDVEGVASGDGTRIPAGGEDHISTGSLGSSVTGLPVGCFGTRNP